MWAVKVALDDVAGLAVPAASLKVLVHVWVQCGFVDIFCGYVLALSMISSVVEWTYVVCECDT